MLIPPRSLRAAIAACLGLFLALLASPAQAQTPNFTVTSTDDTLNAGNGLTLRDAITMAVSSGQPASITFDSTAFDPANGPYEIDLTAVLPDLPNRLTITGPGPNVLTIKGEGANALGPDGPYRIFRVQNGNTVFISGLTIENGLAQGTPGTPGSGSNPTAGSNGMGGAIYNSGTLSLPLLFHRQSCAGRRGRLWGRRYHARRCRGRGWLRRRDLQRWAAVERGSLHLYPKFCARGIGRSRCQHPKRRWRQRKRSDRRQRSRRGDLCDRERAADHLHFYRQYRLGRPGRKRWRLGFRGLGKTGRHRRQQQGRRPLRARTGDHAFVQRGRESGQSRQWRLSN